MLSFLFFLFFQKQDFGALGVGCAMWDVGESEKEEEVEGGGWRKAESGKRAARTENPRFGRDLPPIRKERTPCERLGCPACGTETEERGWNRGRR